uniref:Uncharacterized protein n=1 Tax=Meloidogyne floridensis TaxID=298350 RepID=A0A915NCA5_9BILA
MSEFYRKQINKLFIPATKILENQKAFPVPIKYLNQTTIEFHDYIRSIINDLDIEKQNATFILDNLSSSHSQWMDMRISMTENERLNDSQIFEEFLQKTPYLKIINEIKRYSRKLRRYRNDLENSLPKNCLQFDHSDLLPELNLTPDCFKTLNSSPNQPFKANPQSLLQSPYNPKDHFYRNRNHTHCNLSPNHLNQEKLPCTQNSTVNNLCGSQILNSQSNNIYNEISIGPPPGFDSFENVTTIDKKLINVNCDNKQHINSEEAQHNLNDNPPPGFPPLEEISISKNTPNDSNDFICEEFTPLPEIINEINKVNPDNHSEGISLVLPNGSVLDLSPNPPISLLNNLQRSNSSQIILSSETTYISSSEEILKEKEIIDNNGNCVKKLLKKPRKEQRNLPKPRELIVKNHFRHPVPILHRSFKKCKIAPQNGFKYNLILSKYRYAYMNNIGPSPELQ